MVTVSDFSRLVAAIYAAAVTAERWDATLAELVSAFDGTVGGLGLARPAPGTAEIQVHSIGADPSWRRTYNEYYGRLDHVAAAIEQSPVGLVRTGTELILPHVHSEFHADWIRPIDCEDGVFVRLTEGAVCQWLAVAAPRRSEPFGTTERRTLMRQLVPHLQQAIHTQGKLADLTRRHADLTGAIELVQHGIVIVGAGCRVVHLNSAAESILTAGDGLHIRASGSITATVMHADRELHRLVRRALGDGSSRIPGGGSFTCPRPSGQRAYAVHVVPLGRESTELVTSAATALVLIIDPAREPEPEAAVLRRLYGLTTTEAEVALRVLRCEGLNPVADELSVSLTTIRTHLQHVFDKTDTHRQAELVRLLLAISPR
ncbi:MAG: helix-turn-helix transcriptional regulator [Rhodococcus sp. (in: high G+C Gram-positive bacteria)]|nr:MAG: helix-turn-helix transcriptional regulator [Rhodococcus sp. (in: high G+C Gram-positive bacteria)]